MSALAFQAHPNQECVLKRYNSFEGCNLILCSSMLSASGIHTSHFDWTSPKNVLQSSGQNIDDTKPREIHVVTGVFDVHTERIV
jgi:hypothetical protein